MTRSCLIFAMVALLASSTYAGFPVKSPDSTTSKGGVDPSTVNQPATPNGTSPFTPQNSNNSSDPSSPNYNGPTYLPNNYNVDIGKEWKNYQGNLLGKAIHVIEALFGGMVWNPIVDIGSAFARSYVAIQLGQVFHYIDPKAAQDLQTKAFQDIIKARTGLSSLADCQACKDAEKSSKENTNSLKTALEPKT